jgi:DNA-binding GntR family transcriptional regulator
LREVFRMLTKDGLLKHEPNRGVFVAIPSIAAIIDIYRVRRLIECQALAQAYPRHPAKKKMREAVEMALRCRDAGDWLGVGTANMEFHMAIVELADSERLNVLFAQVLAELRLAFGLLRDPEFLHAPYVDMNTNILELIEAGEFAERGCGAERLPGALRAHRARGLRTANARRRNRQLTWPARPGQAAASSSSFMPSCVASKPRRS